MATVLFLAPTWLGTDESPSVSLRGLWKEKGQVTTGLFNRTVEEGWQEKSRQEASQCVSAAGISFMLLRRVHTLKTSPSGPQVISGLLEVDLHASM